MECKREGIGHLAFTLLFEEEGEEGRRLEQKYMGQKSNSHSCECLSTTRIPRQGLKNLLYQCRAQFWWITRQVVFTGCQSIYFLGGGSRKEWHARKQRAIWSHAQAEMDMNEYPFGGSMYAEMDRYIIQNPFRLHICITKLLCSSSSQMFANRLGMHTCIHPSIHAYKYIHTYIHPYIHT